MADDGDSSFTSSVEEQDSIAKAKSPQKSFKKIVSDSWCYKPPNEHISTLFSQKYQQLGGNICKEMNTFQETFGVFGETSDESWSKLSLSLLAGTC